MKTSTETRRFSTTTNTSRTTDEATIFHKTIFEKNYEKNEKSTRGKKCVKDKFEMS